MCIRDSPSLIAKEGRNFEDVVKEITSIVDGPISAEVISLDSEGMVKEAMELSKIHKNIVIKIPMTVEGLKAVKVLSKEKIKTNVTLIFSAGQALLAAKAGAAYVSPFVGRLDDIANDGMTIIKDTVEIFKNYDLDTEIIAASIRHPMHVIEAAKLGCHIATVPYKVIVLSLIHICSQLLITVTLVNLATKNRPYRSLPVSNVTLRTVPSVTLRTIPLATVGH